MRFKIDENLPVEAAELLRLRTQDKSHVLDILRRLLPLLSSDPLTHHLWIVEEERVRIRG